MSTSSYIAVRPPVLNVRELKFAAERPSQFPAEDVRMVGDGAAMRRLRTQLQRLGPHFRTALISGETGTGKELTARELHRLSPRADGPFVVFHAASVGEALVERQGSAEMLPTPADDLDSMLRAAYGGTLFFDEISEMPATMQAQLLEVLHRKNLIARGTRGMQRGETRIIASTSQNLSVLASAGRFRKDLYYRIAAVEIALPPLRERMEDVPALTEYFLLRSNGNVARSRGGMTSAALSRLMEHTWPGNVRELKNLVCRVSMERGEIAAEDVALILDAASGTAAAGLPGKATRLQEVIEQHVLHVLQCCGGNKVRAAELLGISRSTLYRMLDVSAAAEGIGTLR